MKKIAIINNKGGVAKTTSVYNLGAYFAKKGLKTLLIDLDPQGNLTFACGLDQNNLKHTIFDVLQQKKLFTNKVATNLNIIPSNLNAEKANMQFITYPSYDTLLSRILQPYEEEYDVCLIDSSPSLSLLTRNALGCANAVYIPIEAGIFELIGSRLLIENIIDLKEAVNPELEISGIFLTKYNPRTVVTKQLMKTVEETFKTKLLKSKIRINIALREAPTTAQNIFDYSPKSNGAKDYENLGNEILEIEELI